MPVRGRARGAARARGEVRDPDLAEEEFSVRTRKVDVDVLTGSLVAACSDGIGKESEASVVGLRRDMADEARASQEGRGVPHHFDGRV